VPQITGHPGKDTYLPHRPLSVSIALIFILLNAGIWLALGVIIAADVHPALPNVPIIRGIMAFLSLVTAGILLGVFIFLRKPSRIAYFIALGLLAAISFLTIFDQFGLVDLVVIAINLVPIFLLIKDRAWYLHGTDALAESNRAA
jgi:hypothetical protein